MNDSIRAGILYGFMRGRVECRAKDGCILEAYALAYEGFGFAAGVRSKNHDKLEGKILVNDGSEFLQQEFFRGGGFDEPLHQQNVVYRADLRGWGGPIPIRGRLNGAQGVSPHRV